MLAKNLYLDMETVALFINKVSLIAIKRKITIFKIEISWQLVAIGEDVRILEVLREFLRYIIEVNHNTFGDICHSKEALRLFVGATAGNNNHIWFNLWKFSRRLIVKNYNISISFLIDAHRDYKLLTKNHTKRTNSRLATIRADHDDCLNLRILFEVPFNAGLLAKHDYFFVLFAVLRSLRLRARSE